MKGQREPELLERSRGDSNRSVRRIVIPLLVLVTAGAIFLYARQRDAQQLTEVRDAARELSREVIDMPPGGAIPPTGRRMQASLSAIEALQGALEAQSDMSDVAIIVRPGDAEPPFGDGGATHQAYVQVDGRTRIALRIIHRNQPDDMRLVGYRVIDES